MLLVTVQPPENRPSCAGKTVRRRGRKGEFFSLIPFRKKVNKGTKNPIKERKKSSSLLLPLLLTARCANVATWMWTFDRQTRREGKVSP